MCQQQVGAMYICTLKLLSEFMHYSSYVWGGSCCVFSWVQSNPSPIASVPGPSHSLFFLWLLEISTFSRFVDGRCVTICCRLVTRSAGYKYVFKWAPYLLVIVCSSGQQSASASFLALPHPPHRIGGVAVALSWDQSPWWCSWYPHCVGGYVWVGMCGCVIINSDKSPRDSQC